MTSEQPDNHSCSTHLQCISLLNIMYKMNSTFGIPQSCSKLRLAIHTILRNHHRCMTMKRK